MIDPITLAKIRNVLIVAEQGAQKMNYGAVYIYNDGPGNCRQITLGIGFTQYGNLGKVLAKYATAGGTLSDQIGRYAGAMSKPDTVHNMSLINLLKQAGSDPVMQQIQSDLFDSLYIQKGIDWGETEGFTLPLSFLVICDSFLHSGSILSTIRNRFPDRTPKGGGQEKNWITEYTNARQKWLANHSNRILHATVYRTKYYLQLIGKEDWQLDEYSSIAMNGVLPANVSTA